MIFNRETDFRETVLYRSQNIIMLDKYSFQVKVALMYYVFMEILYIKYTS